MQPSTMRRSYWPHEGHDGPRGASSPTTLACGSVLRPIPSPAMNPVAIMCCSMTPPMAARIDGMYLPFIQAPPRGLEAVLANPEAQKSAMALTMDRLGRGGESPGLRAARAVLDAM